VDASRFVTFTPPRKGDSTTTARSFNWSRPNPRVLSSILTLPRFPFRQNKGGNRWCTMIREMMRAAKYSGTPSARARTIILVGDNYAENKCNSDLDFCTEIVQRGWYDEVQLLYGYVALYHSQSLCSNQSLSPHLPIAWYPHSPVDSTAVCVQASWAHTQWGGRNSQDPQSEPGQLRFCNFRGTCSPCSLVWMSKMSV
jgi:hypothetical protein